MIWYSHVNEDSSVERKFSQDYETLFCVVGSGERVIALLDNQQIQQVYAVDTNLDAIQLLKLKLQALTVLDVNDYLGFIGSKKMGVDERIICFKNCLKELDSSSKRYWDRKGALIEKGILYAGQYEVFLAKIRPFLKVLLGTSFYKIFDNDYTYFPSIRWRLVRFFFSIKIVFKLFGNKDVSFVGNQADVSLISTSFQELIDRKEMKGSFMAHLVFKGHLEEMSKDSVPPSLNPEILKSIQKRLRNKEVEISYEHESILNVLKKYKLKLKAQKICCSMSDILSFEKPEYVLQCIKSLAFIENASIVFVIRSFLRNHIENIHIKQIVKLGFTFESFTQSETSNMYKVYIAHKNEQDKL